jgi:hypothetical protein
MDVMPWWGTVALTFVGWAVASTIPLTIASRGRRLEHALAVAQFKIRDLQRLVEEHTHMVDDVVGNLLAIHDIELVGGDENWHAITASLSHVMFASELELHLYLSLSPDVLRAYDNFRTAVQDSLKPLIASAQRHEFPYIEGAVVDIGEASQQFAELIQQEFIKLEHQSRI